MKIAFFELKDWEIDYLQGKLEGHDVLMFREKLEDVEFKEIEDIDIASIFLYSDLCRTNIDRLFNLKMIATRSTGYDHIDLRNCKQKGLIICNVPKYGENTVAEHVFALLLSLSRNVHNSYIRTEKKDYSIEGLKGFDLMGKTIGVVGLGSIGKHVINIANGFGMNVIAYNRTMHGELANEMNFEYVPLEVLFQKADILTLHVPETPETHHMINKETINLLKKGVILINTARGGLIESEALVEALDKGIIAKAGLDVIEDELILKEEQELLNNPERLDELNKIKEENEILSRSNVLYTPHIAFYSQEALERILDTTIGNIKSFIYGNCVNCIM